jgi:hypothetical protein
VNSGLQKLGSEVSDTVYDSATDSAPSSVSISRSSVSTVERQPNLPPQKQHQQNASQMKGTNVRKQSIYHAVARQVPVFIEGATEVEPDPSPKATARARALEYASRVRRSHARRRASTPLLEGGAPTRRTALLSSREVVEPLRSQDSQGLSDISTVLPKSYVSNPAEQSPTVFAPLSDLLMSPQI